jgi:ABC-2 type transport system permease protein
MKLTRLIKLQLGNNLSLKRFFGFDIKKNKVKGILIIAAIIYAAIAMIGTFGYLFFDLGKILNEINQIHILLSFSTVYAIGFTIITVLLRASGYLFYYKDYEILAPLPIHSRKIFISKLAVLLIMIYVINFIVTLPIMFSYFYWNGFDILGILLYSIGLIFIPLVPFMLLSIISLGISLLTSKMKYSKIFTLILMIGVLLGIMALSFSLNDTQVNPLTGQIDVFANMTKYYLPFKWFNNAIYNNSILELLYIIGSHGLLFIIYIYFIEKLAEFTNKRGIRSNIKYKQKNISYQEKPVIRSIVEKEFKKFFNSTLYALNSGVGLVLMIVMSIASLFFKADIETYFSQEFGVGLSAELLIMGLFAFMIGMTYTPAVSLSLEGKNLWILKSLPIKPFKVMYAKILFNLILVLPIAIISLIMLGISLQISILNILLLMLLIISFATLTSFMQSVINLYLPKFDYNNDAEVVKQSAAALLAILGVFVLMIIFGFGIYFMTDVLSIELIMIILTASSIGFTIPFFIILRDKSEKVFLNF